MITDIVTAVALFVGGFWCGTKFKTFAALKEAIAGWFGKHKP